MLPVVQLLNSFTFATLPLQQGMFNIQTPERLFHLQHGATLPYFQIINTSTPVRHGPFTLIAADCMIMGHPQSLRIFTDSPDESNVLCLRNGTPTTLLKFRVGPRTPRGHALVINTKCFRAPRLTQRMLTPFLFFMMYIEGSAKHRIPLHEDKNLKLYRSMVFQNGTVPK